MRIFLVGFMGSGKTTIARKLAARLNLRFIDMDAYIEQISRLSIEQIFEQLGEKQFRDFEKVALESLIKEEDIIIATGGGTPCFHDNIDVMNEWGETIYLKLEPEALAYRLKNSKKPRPLIEQFKRNGGLLEYIMETLGQREDYYVQAKHVVEAKNLKINQLVDLIEREILVC